MDAERFTVADLASDEGLVLRCYCMERPLLRADLIRLVGSDARLHMLGLRPELRCGHCGDPPMTGRVMWTSARR
jgi:hypothetical protein